MSNTNFKNIKKIMQNYWENLSSLERRWILSHIIIEKELPYDHAIMKNDDIPYNCARAWIEETIAKKDWDLEYSSEPCHC